MRDKDNEKYISIKLPHDGEFFFPIFFYNNVKVANHVNNLSNSSMNNVLKISTPSSYVDLIIDLDYVIKKNNRYSIFTRVSEVRVNRQEPDFSHYL